MSKQVTFSCLLGIASSFQLIFAQVTIGSDVKPNGGALLELKEKNTPLGEVNSTRGLGLPRVELTDKNNLFPMFEEGAENYIASEKKKRDLEHIGLLVYHVNTNNDPILQSGLYVWNGSEWLSLYGTKEDFSTDQPGEDEIGYGNGVSGTVYKTRKFGDAGTWMVENLRETMYDEGETRAQQPTEKINTYYTMWEANYYYPNKDKALFEKHPEYGLLYNLVAATNGRVTDRPGATETSGRVQGLCPKGWVVPSRLDWRRLREELSKNPEKYSENEEGNKIGYTAKSPITVSGVSQKTNGVSLQYGFNALLVGTIRDGNVLDYGQRTGFWSSSVLNDQTAYYRELIYNYDYAVSDQNYDWAYSMKSIRCIKGEVF